MKKRSFYESFMVVGFLLFLLVSAGDAATFSDSFNNSSFTNSNWADYDTGAQQTWSFSTLSAGNLGYHASATSSSPPAVKLVNSGTEYDNKNLYIETLVRIDSYPGAYKSENMAGIAFSLFQSQDTGYAANIQLDYDGNTEISLGIGTVNGDDWVETPVAISFDTFYKLKVYIDSSQYLYASLFKLDGTLLGRVTSTKVIPLVKGAVALFGGPEVTFDNFSLTGNPALHDYFIPLFKPQPNYWSGLGITNMSSTGKANITTTIYSNTGTSLETQTRSIPAGGQDKFIIGDALSSSGWIKITSNQRLAGLNFLGQYKSGSTNSYLADVPFTDKASKSLLIPHVSQNPSWDTTVYIANTESSPGSITLTYKDKNGVASTPYVVSIHGNGTQEISVGTIAKSTEVYGGSVTITSTRNIAAFALYHNLKTGNFSYAGINAVDL